MKIYHCVLYSSQGYLRTKMRDLDHHLVAGAENTDNSNQAKAPSTHMSLHDD
jgi:hypothetical protein